MIPLFLDLSGRRVGIFGGGVVAARKAAYFAPEARVYAISRSFRPEMEALKIRRKQADVSGLSDAKLATMIGNAFLVIAALSDPELNNRIGRICKKKGILFNNADGEPGDVTLPALCRGEEFTIAVSTGSSSPAVSRFVREYLARELPDLDAMILLQNRLREELKRTETDPARRNAILRRVLEDPTVWKRLRTDPERAWENVAERFLHA